MSSPPPSLSSSTSPERPAKSKDGGKSSPTGRPKAKGKAKAKAKKKHPQASPESASTQDTASEASSQQGYEPYDPDVEDAKVNLRTTALVSKEVEGVIVQDYQDIGILSEQKQPKMMEEMEEIQEEQDEDFTKETGRTSIQVDNWGDDNVSVPQMMILLTCVFLPNILTMIVFSPIGHGLDVYNAVSPPAFDLVGSALACVAVFLILSFYIFDWSLWPFRLKMASASVPIVLILASSVLKARAYPWAPLVLILFLIPFFCALARISVCREVERTSFYKAFFGCTFCCSVALLFIYVFWVMFLDNEWTDSTKLKLAKELPELWKAYDVSEAIAGYGSSRPLSPTLDCGVGGEKNLDRFDTEQKTEIGVDCKRAITVMFTSWASPLIGILATLFLGVFSFLSLGTTHLKGSGDVGRLELMMKRFLGFLVCIMMGMYFSCSLSGTSVQLGSTMMAFFASALTVLVITMYIEIGRESFEKYVGKSKLTVMLFKAWQSDWARAVFLGGFNIMLPVFLVLNMLKKKAQRRRDGGVDDDKFTDAGRKMVTELSTWNWASILVKICLLGELFFTFQVGVAKATYIFLSWLNGQLASVDYAVVIVIIFFIGYAMFLLPPVPGVPVYVFCGIVVAEQGRQLESVGFTAGCLIACILAWCLKLAACTGQYFIGFFAGKYLSIQTLIGVDKVPTRAIEAILKVPGLSIGKVSVLVGGPDWPTSVTCGILKLSIPQMLLGTAPVFFVSSPCVLAGAFLARVEVGEESIWSALASSFTALAVVGQMGCGFMAVSSITKEIDTNGEEHAEPRPEHEAVAELSRQQAILAQVYNEVTDFKKLDTNLIRLICAAASLQLLSGIMFAMGGEYCFRPFAVSSDINHPYEENGLKAPGDKHGKPSNIVLPAGWLALGFFALGTLLHILFSKATNKLAAERLKAGDVEMPPLSNTPDASLIGNAVSPSMKDLAETE